jgi:hypothetical protein
MLTEETLARTPRQLGTLNQLRFVTSGPGSGCAAWGILLLWVALIMGADRTVIDWVGFAGARTVPGTITEADETGWEVNERDLWYFVFKYQVDGKEYHGISFCTGNLGSTGNTVDVQVIRPGLARIKGGSLSKLGFFAAVPLAVAVILLPLALRGYRRGWRWQALLQYGRPMSALLVSRKATGTEINGAAVMVLTYAFEGDQGATHELVIKTHHTSELTDDEAELGLYNPADPTNACLLDQIPDGMTMSQPGVWDPPAALGRIFFRLIWIVGFSILVLIGLLRRLGL